MLEETDFQGALSRVPNEPIPLFAQFSTNPTKNSKPNTPGIIHELHSESLFQLSSKNLDSNLKKTLEQFQDVHEASSDYQVAPSMRYVKSHKQL